MRLLVSTAIVVIAALLLLNAAYCWNGSLEEFPTDEQHEKIRVGTLAVGCVLAVVELALVYLARQLRRRESLRPSTSRGIP